MYAAGKIPGSFFRREGKSSDQAILTCRLIDRPLRPVFPDGLPQRGPRRGHGARRRHGEPPRRARHQRRVGGAEPLGHPLRRPHRRRAHRLLDRGHLDPAPDLRGGRRRPRFEMVVAGRLLDDGDVAIIDGRGRRHRDRVGGLSRTAPPRSPRPCSPRASRRRSRGSASPSSCSASWSRRPAASTPIIEYEVQVDYTPEVLDGRREGRPATRIADVQRSPTSTSACRPRRDLRAEIIEQLLPEFERRRRRREAPEGGRTGRSPRRSCAGASSRRAPASTAAAPPTSARCPPRCGVLPVGARLGPVPAGRDPGAERRHARHAAHGADARHARHPRPQALHAPLQLPALLHGRDRLHAGPQAPRDRPRRCWPSGRCCRCCRPRPSSPTRSARVSDVLSSNGSTSMGSVCASTLSLMDAGVPIKAPVAGIAMGLVFAEGKYTTLTDILGAEDAFGDMDFKVAGTAEFVTALQLDTKIDGIPADVLAQALEQAKEARLKILEVMAERHRRAPARGRRHRPEDRQLRDPDGQDRRGHRAQGQGHQRHPAGDRRRHQRRRRRHGGHGVDRLDRLGRGGRGRAPDPPHPQPAHRRGRPGVPGPGGEHHQVRRLRQHPPRPRRPAAHLQDGRRQARQPGRGRRSTSATRSR